MNTPCAAMRLGQVVRHKLFDYRGVVVDVDPEFSLSDDWYEAMARSRPPRDKPWYHVLVDGAAHRTYVAERNLEPDESGAPIHHPEIGAFFSRFDGGAYVPNRAAN